MLQPFKLWSEFWIILKQISCLNHAFDCWWVPVVNHKCEYNLYKSTAHLHVVSFPFLFHSFSFLTRSSTPPILRGRQSLCSRSFAMAQVTQCSTGRSHARTLSEYSIHQNHCGPYEVVEPIFWGDEKLLKICVEKKLEIPNVKPDWIWGSTKQHRTPSGKEVSEVIPKHIKTQ